MTSSASASTSLVRGEARVRTVLVVIKVDRVVPREVGQVVGLGLGVEAGRPSYMHLLGGKRLRHRTMLSQIYFFMPTACLNFI